MGVETRVFVRQTRGCYKQRVLRVQHEMGFGFDEKETEIVCEKTNAGGCVSRRERRRGESQARIRGSARRIREEYAGDIEFV